MSLKLATMKISLFRNIKDTTLHFGSNINIISGQNGVGKSNILSLIASGTGTSLAQFKTDLTNTDAQFQPDFMNYFVINTNMEKTIEPFHHYQVYSSYVDDAQHLKVSKYLRFKDDSNQKLTNNPSKARPVRIVPTTVILDDQLNRSGQVADAHKFCRENDISYEGRLKIPTQYLSLSRLMPRGEVDIKAKKIPNKSSYVTSSEAEKYKTWYNKVVPKSITTPEAFKTTKGTFSETVDEELDHTTLKSVSVGQDSLSKIISSLVNFDIISHTPNYEGGILCIDEFDVSLHPDAQNRLLKLLDSLSHELNLQIFLTTHSITAIKKFFSIKKEAQTSKQEEYGFVYFRDRRFPELLKNPTYEKIAADLSLASVSSLPNIKIYLEDQWTSRLFNVLFETCLSLGLLNKFNREYIKEIDATFGKNNLIQLSKTDENFQQSILVLDGDANFSDSKNYSTGNYILGEKNWPSIPRKPYYANVVTLPCPFSPEAFIYYLVNKFVRAYDEQTIREFWSEQSDNLPFGRQFIDERLLLDADMVKKLGERFNTDFLKGKGDANKQMKLNAEDLTALNGYNNHTKDERMEILFDIVKETHMCTKFYELSSTGKSLLNEFATNLDTAYETCQRKLMSKRL